MEMVCIGNGNGMHFLAIVWYAVEMVWYGTTCIGIENDNGNGMVCIGNGMNGMVWYAWYGMVWYALVMICIALPLYGMHWQWYGIVRHALALAMKMEMVCYGMLCIDNGNGNGIHWQWKWYALVWYHMVCISNGMRCQWYALEIVYHTIANAYHTMHTMVCISLPLEMVWYGMVWYVLALAMKMVWYHMHWHWQWKWK
jgi:hypothetical protein